VPKIKAKEHLFDVVVVDENGDTFAKVLGCGKDTNIVAERHLEQFKLISPIRLLQRQNARILECI